MGIEADFVVGSHETLRLKLVDQQDGSENRIDLSAYTVTLRWTVNREEQRTATMTKDASQGSEAEEDTGKGWAQYQWDDDDLQWSGSEQRARLTVDVVIDDGSHPNAMHDELEYWVRRPVGS